MNPFTNVLHSVARSRLLLFARLMSTQGWTLSSTRAAKAAINPIRECTEKHYVEAIKKSKKDLYKLGIGDPSVFGNLPPHPAVLQAVQKALEGGDTFSYGLSYGYEVTRTAIAEKFSTPDRPLSADDIIMTTGCAGALELCFNVLCESGSNVLVPAPCYSLYNCLGGAMGVDLKYYTLLADRSWEADLEDLDRQVDSNTKAIVVNNPSNPCGSVYSREHLQGIVGVARKHRLPIIADEVYAGVVFRGHEFFPVSSVAEEVPVLTCTSLSKRYVIPGWRVGWVILHDKRGMLEQEIKPGLRRLATRNIGPCGIVQRAIPDIFKNVPDSFFAETVATFEENAHICYERLCHVEGLRPVMPAGAMYMMVEMDLSKFPEFEDDVSFLKQLIVEQGVICLPGSAFQRPSAMRVAVILPKEKLAIACDRIEEFCSTHIVKN